MLNQKYINSQEKIIHGDTNMNGTKIEMVNGDTQKMIEKLQEQKSDLEFLKQEKQNIISKMNQTELELIGTAEKLTNTIGEIVFCFCGYGDTNKKSVLSHIIKKHGVTQ